MQRRFFVDEPITGQEVQISGPDAHHILQVNRFVVEDTITLFDGSGKEFEAKITEVAKKRLTVEIVLANDVSREIEGELLVAVALPKGDRQKVLVEKMVELGVTRLIPINCERSVAQLKEKSLDRLNRWIIEASKQCGRNVLMHVDSPVKFGDMITSFPRKHCRFLAHPYGGETDGTVDVRRLDMSQAVVVAIGPEGGFSEPEVENAVAAGWKCLKLGRSILRVETAAAAVATLFGIGRQIGSE